MVFEGTFKARINNTRILKHNQFKEEAASESRHVILESKSFRMQIAGVSAEARACSLGNRLENALKLSQCKENKFVETSNTACKEKKVD